MIDHRLTQAVKAYAHQLGFDHCWIAPAGRAAHADFFDGWVALGRAGEMQYLERSRSQRRLPALLAGADQPPVRSIIVLAVNYHQFDLPPAVASDPSRGRIAAYAWGDDYHEIIRPLLYALDGFLRDRTGRTALGKCLVDTGPVLERDWAQTSGLGFTGKNCCTIHRRDGSWLLLATVAVPEELAWDAPLQLEDTAQPAPAAVLQGLSPAGEYGRWRQAGQPAARPLTCGRCTRCLTACPTDAFVGPYHLDPQRCISYWTIEAQSAIPRELRKYFGNWIFGCDRCQEVCPYNHRLPQRTPLQQGLAAHAGRAAPLLLEGFQPATPYWLNPEVFAAHFRRSPVKRAKRHGMLRNVCVALGNWGAPEAVPALVQALHDPHPLPRGHAAWALGEAGRHSAASGRRDAAAQISAALTAALAAETDGAVQSEICLALAVD